MLIAELRNISWIPSKMFRYYIISDFVSAFEHKVAIQTFPKTTPHSKVSKIILLFKKTMFKICQRANDFWLQENLGYSMVDDWIGSNSNTLPGRLDLAPDKRQLGER